MGFPLPYLQIDLAISVFISILAFCKWELNYIFHTVTAVFPPNNMEFMRKQRVDISMNFCSLSYNWNKMLNSMN